MRHIFIINPVSGKKNITERISNEIDAVCARRGINPLIFISEYNGYERFIAEKMCSLFTDEDIRFYCVGGSGTLVQTLSGLDDGANRQLACYPAGLTNDFLKCYEGFSRGFHNVEALLDGRIDSLDYIKVMGHCKSLDFVCIGLGNSLVDSDSISDFTSRDSTGIGYSFAISIDMLRTAAVDYQISVDGKDYSGRYSFILCMNGRCLGGRLVPVEESRPDDGVMNILLFKEMNGATQGTMVLKYMFGNTDIVKECSTQIKGRRIIISRKDHKHMNLNCDGDAFMPSDTTLDIRLIPAGLKFVVPEHSVLLSPEETASEESE